MFYYYCLLTANSHFKSIKTVEMDEVGMSNSSVLIKVEKEDETETTIPADVQQETGSLFCCGGLIPKNEEELLVPDDALSNSCVFMKEEKEDEIDDTESYCTQNSSDNFEENSQPDLKTSYSNVIASYQCPHCDYKAVKSSILHRHVIAHHTGERPHQCPLCDYKAVWISTLKRHITSNHSESKTHKCYLCDFKTKRKSSLKRHIMASHKDDKPYQCPYCDYKAIRNHIVKRHISGHHGGKKRHQCPHCRYTALKNETVKRHIIALHTGEKRLHCSYCDYKAGQVSSLKRHIKYEHLRGMSKK
ncbi:zinc finger protein 711 isoform X1 [Halyomorpha halys]|uniref:zinc finger protein 711 isoform X1 n=2 Tax=Halyomorpha halys TaxID=286706 RepID=UPI0006D4F686|nr:zinc finger Y-chromosomal protein 1 isoform X1 [Halyomorpha halys]